MDAKAQAFERDAADRGGYVYTTNQKYSSIVANRRQTDAITGMAEFENMSVVDIGCGDGTYTVELYDLILPARIHGIDPAATAIDVARTKVGPRALEFSADGAYALPFADRSFDVAHIRGVLHHLDRPEDALREALRVARTIVVLEPNGYNPILKMIEKISPYHRAHQERSYAPHRIDRWIRDCGGSVQDSRFIGLVPFFCPDGFARALKAIEPIVERLPLIRSIACGNYVLRASAEGPEPR